MRVVHANPRIETIAPMKLVGFGMSMSGVNDSTAALWQNLMPRRLRIEHRIPGRYISMRVYGTSGMSIEEMFHPATEFEKWAAVEVTKYGTVPEGLRTHELVGGDYAVFLHRGPASRFSQTMRYIFGDWLPRSEFELDGREQFEVLPENWRPDDEQAEEQIYVPVRQRSGSA